MFIFTSFCCFFRFVELHTQHQCDLFNGNFPSKWVLRIDHFEFRWLRDITTYIFYLQFHFQVTWAFQVTDRRRWFVRPLVFICISVFRTLPNRNVLYLHLRCVSDYCLIQNSCSIFVNYLYLSREFLYQRTMQYHGKRCCRNEKAKHFFPCFCFHYFVFFLSVCECVASYLCFCYSSALYLRHNIAFFLSNLCYFGRRCSILLLFSFCRVQ